MNSKLDIGSEIEVPLLENRFQNSLSDCRMGCDC